MRTARLRAYFGNTFFFCSNDSPSLFVDDVLQPWTMVKLVLMQIVADADVAVGFFLAQPRTRCWTLSEEDRRCNDHLEIDTDWRLASAGSDDHVSWDAVTMQI